ncbi:dynamin family protein [Sulfurimonas sp.]|nr:dynamin family protein [Sulfurimonas sp.]
MTIFEPLLKEIKNKEELRNEEVNSLESFIKSVSSKLLADEFNPSNSLRSILDKQMRRVKYPMEVAIVGQFSSGKSTFLNALLSKDVLPTGITPVTSKVNFINYAKEYKLKITFKSGATEFHSIEHLAKFTDQREAIEDVKYLSIFAPVEMLKDISFVDTPGLNSQSKFDTDTTNAILRDVDGIIWLGLIDAVAKKSEIDILEKYLPNYASKSACLLNQKDRLSPDEVRTALTYANENYKDYFSKIIAISAIQALDSRVHQKENVLLDEKNRFINDIREEMIASNKDVDISFFDHKLETHNKNIESINKKDYSNYEDELKNSNILDVLEFINSTIRPQAKESKIFAIKKDLSSICNILQNEYTRITSSYSDLAEIIDDFSSNIENKLKSLESEISLHVEMLNVKISEDISANVSGIYEGIKPLTKELLKDKKSILGNSYTKESYQTYMYESNTNFSVKYQESLNALDRLILFSINEVEAILKAFEKELLLWQLKNEKLVKNREVASDEEFSKVRIFSAQMYELLLQDFQLKFDEFKMKMQKRIFKLSFKNRFELACEKTVLNVMQEIAKMQNAYEKDSESSVINSIDESEVLLMFKENLDFEYLKRELQRDNSFVVSDLSESNKELLDTVKESMKKIHVNFDEINDKVRLLDDIKEFIDTEF